MSKIMESAKAHFREKLAGGLESIDVPEWSVDDAPAKVYFKPALNFQAQERIIKLSEEGKKAEAVVQALIERALDEDGNRMFKQVNRLELMKSVDPDVIARVVSEMSGADEYSVDDIEKN